MQLIQEQIAEFNRNGFLLIKGVFQGEELHRLSAAADTVIDEALEGRGENHGRMGDSPSTYFRTEGLIHRDTAFAAAGANPDLLRCIGQCLGHPFQLWYDRMVVKQAHTGVPVGWHQDPPYLGEEAHLETFPIPNFVAGIYLDEATEDNGCIYALPGRHLCGRVTWPDLDEEDLFNHLEAQPIVANAGDVSFHCSSTPHGSRANNSGKPRRLLLYHYVCREVFNDAYADWSNLYGDFRAENVEILRNMQKAREDLGWPSDFYNLSYVEDGVTFVGGAQQTPDAWSKMRVSMSPEELTHLRTVRSPATP